MILVLDNYDSFTHNVVQYLGELGAEVEVFRNDEITVEDIVARSPRGLVISPGPGTPEQAGITVDVIRRLAGHVPLLGICLGHQAIGFAFGGRVVRAPTLMHGKTSLIIHDGRTIFENLPNPFAATRYHSLVIERESLPECLEISATTPDGVIMGVRHRHLFCEGVQFHPESVMSGLEGKRLLKNFLDRL
jgi:anthranilate synthase/aminodeoxychorismate synthase-like glutamine amidotransferase